MLLIRVGRRVVLYLASPIPCAFSDGPSCDLWVQTMALTLGVEVRDRVKPCRASKYGNMHISNSESMTSYYVLKVCDWFGPNSDNAATKSPNNPLPQYFKKLVL